MIGFALFGALTYLPLFQQVVRGASPTESGLQLIPVMAGVLVGSIGSGQVITATGRYKVFPIAGTAIAAVGMLLLVAARRRDSTLYASAAMFVLGLGLGLVMQVLVLAVQNAVEYAELGRRDLRRHAVPLDGRLARHGRARRGLHRPADRRARRHAGRAASAAARRPRPSSGCPRPIRDSYTGAFTDALSTVFLVAAAIVAVAFLLVVADRGAPAAPDGRDGRRRRGVRLADAAATRCAS